MIRLITVITMILMPIISVSTGTKNGEAVLRSLDHLDQRGNPNCGGCPPPSTMRADAQVLRDGDR